MTDGRPKIVKEFNVADEIAQSNVRRSRKGVAEINLDKLHKNQPHELRTHLISDTAHRMMPAFRAAPRATHPTMLGKRP